MKELEARLDFLLANAQQCIWLFTGWGHAKLDEEFRWWQADRAVHECGNCGAQWVRANWHVAVDRAVEKRVPKLQARNLELRQRLDLIMRTGTPWQLKEVLGKLIDAADHLKDHNCDWKEYEEWMGAVDQARLIKEELER